MEKSQMIQAPYFLVGAERSGTTLLRLMLSHHPQIAWCNEFEYAVDKISSNGEFPNLNEYYEWLEINRIFQDSGFVIDSNLSYPELVNDFLLQKQKHTQKEIVGATVHRNFDQTLTIWPEARFIHLVRDPRDVARSCIGMGWAGNIWFGVNRWLVAEETWEKLKQIIPPSRYLEVSYEKLICSPETELKTICQFIGTDYHPKMLSYAEKTTYDKPDSSLIQQWKNKLSQREIQLVEAKVNGWLTKRGYEFSNLPKIQVTPLEEQKLRLHNFSVRSYRRFKKNPQLFVMGYFIRRFGLKSWKKWIRNKQNDLERANLK